MKQKHDNSRFFLLIALLLIGLTGIRAFSQITPHIYLAINSDEVTLGDTVALVIGADEGDSMKTISILMNYDESRYRYLNGSAGEIFQGATFTDIHIENSAADSAIYMVGIMLGAGRYVTAPGVCFNLNFVAIDTGTALFKVDSLTFMTPDLNYFAGTADSLISEIAVVDTFPPGQISDFRVRENGSGQLQFMWRNPNDADFVAVAIYRSEEGFLDSVDDDLTPVYDGDATSYLDENLTNNTIYYYSAFTYDEIPNYSQPVYLKAEPKNKYVFAYPNPFNPAEGVNFRTIFPNETTLDLTIYDLAGQKVIVLYQNETIAANDQTPTLTWNGKNSDGTVVANGVYYYVVKTLQGDKIIGKVAVLR
jgi:hypothetical protein